MKILVLAGGFDQIELIKLLKIRGHYVLLADYSENPPAANFADKFFRISTLDEEAILKLAEDCNVDLVTTACTDQALLTAARVSEKLKLPFYLDTYTAELVTNKKAMKQRFFEYNIPTSKFKVFEDGIFDLDKISEFNYPLVVKPCDCNSSKGISKVWNSEELSLAFDVAYKLSRSNTVICEEYADGDEISIDGWIDNDGAKLLSVSMTNKIINNDDSFTIYQSKYPIEMSEVLISKIERILYDISEAFSLKNCPVLVQAIVKDDSVSVIEFSARMGGGSKYKLIEYMTGVKIMDIYVERILGNVNQIVNPICSDDFIELDYVYSNNGIFDYFTGFDDLLSKGIVKDLFVYKTKGDIITKHTTSSDRILGFLLAEKSVDELNEKRKIVLENFDIFDSNGKSLKYIDYFS